MPHTSDFWQAFWALAASPFVELLVVLLIASLVAVFVGDRANRR